MTVGLLGRGGLARRRCWKEKGRTLETAGQAADLPRESCNSMPLCAAVSVLNSTLVVEPPNWMAATRSVLPSMKASTAVWANFWVAVAIPDWWVP